MDVNITFKKCGMIQALMAFFLLIIENMYKETYLSKLVLAWEQCM